MPRPVRGSEPEEQARLDELPGYSRCMRACCVADVSATNGLSFFAMLQRLGRPGHALLDIVSFRDDPAYIGFSRYSRFNGRTLEGLAPRNVYVNAAVLDIYTEVLSRDWSCLLDCTTTRVNVNTEANLQAHAEEVLSQLARRPLGAALLAERGMAFVFVHGGGTTFLGRVGICFAGTLAATAVAQLQAAVQAAGGDAFRPLTFRSCGRRQYVTQEMLRPLLAQLDAGKKAADAAYVSLMHEKLSLEQLPLTLLLLRTRWPGLPVAVVGHGMVRRSLSIVAVDAARVCQLAVTHEVQWAGEGANAADVTQQFLRASTTLHEFHDAHGFTDVRVLAPAHVWYTVTGAVLFNQWFAASQAGGAPLDREATVAAFGRIEAALARNVSLSTAIFRYLDMPEGVRRYFAHKNPLHARAVTLKALAQATVARYAAAEELMERDGDEDEAAGSDSDAADDAAAAAYRARRAPHARRAHKAEAMAQLRVWLASRSGPETLDTVFLRFAPRSVAGLPACGLIADVLEHTGGERLWVRPHSAFTPPQTLTRGPGCARRVGLPQCQRHPGAERRAPRRAGLGPRLRQPFLFSCCRRCPAQCLSHRPWAGPVRALHRPRAGHHHQGAAAVAAPG